MFSFSEALELLKQGKKIRNVNWVEGNYIFLKSDGKPYSRYDRYEPMMIFNFYEKEWVEYV